MLDEVGGDLVEAVVRRHDLVVLPQQFLQQGNLVSVQICFGHFFRDPVIQIQAGDAELFRRDSRTPA